MLHGMLLLGDVGDFNLLALSIFLAFCCWILHNDDEMQSIFMAGRKICLARRQFIGAPSPKWQKCPHKRSENDISLL